MQSRSGRSRRMLAQYASRLNVGTCESRYVWRTSVFTQSVPRSEYDREHSSCIRVGHGRNLIGLSRTGREQRPVIGAVNADFLWANKAGCPRLTGASLMRKSTATPTGGVGGLPCESPGRQCSNGARSRPALDDVRSKRSGTCTWPSSRTQLPAVQAPRDVVPGLGRPRSRGARTDSAVRIGSCRRLVFTLRRSTTQRV